jgi:hypothetical protein
MVEWWSARLSAFLDAQHTMDDSAETAANYYHLVTAGGPATPICSAAAR